MVTIKIGNIFESDSQTIVNTINCVGIMGKGIAKEFKTRYPDMFKEYEKMCKAGEVKPGIPYLYSDLFGNSIINFPTKDHWRSPSKLSYIYEGLEWFQNNYRSLGVTSVAFPPLGCGNGGLRWEIVGPIMYDKLKDLPIDIEIYAPFGTKNEYLTKEYLKSHLINNRGELLGNSAMKINPKWLLILETIRRINNGRYTLHVGRVITQKICYILTVSGLDTGMTFIKHNYGPYCEQVRDMITAFSNANLIIEKQTGKMMEIQISPDFKIDNATIKKQDEEVINKTVDLFSRVKNTNHAELIATVIFSYNQLLTENNRKPSQEEIIDYVLQWKPRWREKNENNIREAIINLIMLQWISAAHQDFSQSYDVE